MVRNHKDNGLALLIMSAVVALNIGLAINYISASGRALAALFNGHNIFALAGAELLIVLLTYVVTKHKAFPLPKRINSPVNQS